MIDLRQLTSLCTYPWCCLSILVRLQKVTHFQPHWHSCVQRSGSSQVHRSGQLARPSSQAAHTHSHTPFTWALADKLRICVIFYLAQLLFFLYFLTLSRRIYRGAVNLFLFRHYPSKIYWKWSIWNINIQYENVWYTLKKLTKPVFALRQWENLVSSSIYPSWTLSI